MSPSLWGVDVSNHQRGAVLARVKGAGASWVYAKASEGATFKDGQFEGFRGQARGCGLLFGAYHFARPSSSKRPADEAANFLAAIGSVQAGELPPVLDVETCGDLAPDALAAWVLEWLRLVEHATGVRPMVYTFASFARANLTAPALGSYRLWMAAYQAREPRALGAWARPGWVMWQNTSAARVPGIPGLADRSVTHLDAAGLAALTRKAPPRPPAPAARPPAPVLPHPVTPPAPARPATPAPAPDPYALGRRVLLEGMHGPDVAFVQRFLGLHDDGDYGPETRAAVEHYQAVRFLRRDGEVGPKTWAPMLSAVAH